MTTWAISPKGLQRIRLSEREQHLLAVDALSWLGDEQGLVWFLKNGAPNKILLDESSRAGRLWYLWNMSLGGRMFFLEYSCPSTGKVYVSGISPRPLLSWITVRTDGVPESSFEKVGRLAEIAMAWKLDLSLSEYYSIAAEA
jgi:hypothetical protein